MAQAQPPSRGAWATVGGLVIPPKARVLQIRLGLARVSLWQKEPGRLLQYHAPHPPRACGVLVRLSRHSRGGRFEERHEMVSQYWHGLDPSQRAVAQRQRAMAAVLQQLWELAAACPL